MGRRSKADQPGAQVPEFDTVGVTILPGRPLPSWATAEEVAPEPQAPAWPATGQAAAEVPASTNAAAAEVPAMPATDAPAATAATDDPRPPDAPAAMAGALVGAGIGAGVGAAPPMAYGAPWAPAPGSPPPAAPAYPGYPPPATAPAPPDQGARYSAPAPGSPPPGAPASPGMPASAGPATAAALAGALEHPGMPASAALAGALEHPAMTAATGPTSPTDVMAAPPPAPAAQEPPQLSAEHVALLIWWAEMIRTGQAPGGMPDPEIADAVAEAGVPASAPAAPRPADRTRSGHRTALKVTAVVVGGVALATGAVLFGPQLVSTFIDEPPQTAVTELTMPAGVGELVALPAEAAEAALPPALGLGLRPLGVTVTQAYGAAPDSPMVLAALASTAPAQADATGQAMSWAERTGATLGDPVAGTGSAAGITCAPASDLEGAPPGSICIWLDPAMRGQAYVVGAEPADALERTAELRAGVSPTTVD